PDSPASAPARRTASAARRRRRWRSRPPPASCGTRTGGPACRGSPPRSSASGGDRDAAEGTSRDEDQRRARKGYLSLVKTSTVLIDSRAFGLPELVPI